MSRADVDLVQRAFDAWDRGAIDEVRGMMADDLVTYRADPDGASYHGVDGFFQALADWTEDFSDWSVRADRFDDRGEFVVVRVRQSARGKASGVAIEEDFWFVFRLRDETVAGISFYSREPDALRAAGG